VRKLEARNPKSETNPKLKTCVSVIQSLGF
jgi:DNA-binding phage protein